MPNAKCDVSKTYCVSMGSGQAVEVPAVIPKLGYISKHISCHVELVKPAVNTIIGIGVLAAFMGLGGKTDGLSWITTYPVFIVIQVKGCAWAWMWMYIVVPAPEASQINEQDTTNKLLCLDCYSWS